MKQKNKNDIPLSSLEEIQPLILPTDIIGFDEFKKICELSPNKELEKLNLINEDNDLINKRGVVYLFLIDGKVIKIGSSIVSMKERISSYNTGKLKYREDGTCSTTNYFILQSFLNLNVPIDVYGYFPKEVEVMYDDVILINTSTAKTIEGYLLKKIKEKCGSFPVFCTQG